MMRRWLDYWWDRLLRRKAWTYWNSDTRRWVPERMAYQLAIQYTGEPLFLWWNRPAVTEYRTAQMPAGPPPHILEQIYGPTEPGNAGEEAAANPFLRTTGSSAVTDNYTGGFKWNAPTKSRETRH